MSSKDFRDIVNQEHQDVATAKRVMTVDDTGSYVTPGGAGTQYTEGDTDATITGTAALGEAPADTLEVLQLDANKYLKINISADDVGIGGGTQYDEDTVHNSGDTGTMALVVRNDTLASLVDADGDYAPLQVDSDGALYVTATQAGTWNINNISGTISLPTGAATEATLSSIDTDTTTIAGDTTSIDGKITACNTGDVTIGSALPAGDNNIGNVDIVTMPDVDINDISKGVQTNDVKVTLDGETVTIQEPLSVDDNGGSLTIDNAALSVTGGGAEATALRVTIANDSTGVVSVDDNGGSLTIDNASLTAMSFSGDDLQVTLDGENINIGDISAGVQTNDVKVTMDGEVLEVNEVQNVAGFEPTVDAGGDVSHDGADSGNPVKIGSKAFDHEPDSAGQKGPAEVAANDRANMDINLQGQQIMGVNCKYHEPTNIDTTYNNVTTTATSAWYECWNYRYCTFGFDLDKANTPTDIQIEVELELGDGASAKKLMNGPLGMWIYDDTAVGSGIERAYTFPICAYKMRIKVTATGTDASNTFTMANSCLYFRN